MFLAVKLSYIHEKKIVAANHIESPGVKISSSGITTHAEAKIISIARPLA